MSAAPRVGRLRVAGAVLTLIFSLCCLAADAQLGFTIATAPYRYDFPRDHGAHDDYETEWWYFTGHIRSPGGRTFGYELTFFRFGLRPGNPRPSTGQSSWRGNQTYAAHFAITDVDERRFSYHTQFSREALGMAGSATGRLAVHLGDWTLTGTPTRSRKLERMHLLARAGSEAVDFTLVPQKPPAIHGVGGISKKASCRSCASHYYSYTRLGTRGQLEYAGTRMPVTGTSWMDHEYGSHELQPDEAGWDWFSLQLDDGREIMLYLLRRNDGTHTPESSGSLIERDGRVTHLALGEFRVTVPAGARWHSPHTNATYPAEWTVGIPRAGITAALTPLVADQELVLQDAALTYWEGAVSVRDANTGRRLGDGYVELTGYAAPIFR